MAIIFAGKPADVGAEAEETFESNLIALIKFYPWLYDPSHSDYSNMQRSQIAWTNLSNSLQKTVLDCINKWYALLQIFLCLNKQTKVEDSCSSIIWRHYYVMLKMRSALPQTYAQVLHEKPRIHYVKPVSQQKELLVKLMEFNRLGLFSVLVPLEHKQKIWLQMSQQLNSVYNGGTLPVIKWQKYWCDLKQSIIEIKRRCAKEKDECKNGSAHFVTHKSPVAPSPDRAAFSDDDVKILSLFGVQPTDTLDQIVSALTCYIEIDSDMANPAVGCSRCSRPIDVNKKYCDGCTTIPTSFCDICLRMHEAKITMYRVRDWSTAAKQLLPSHLAAFSTISACAACTNELKKQASAKWTACRICASHIHPLDQLFSNENEILRKVFTDATNISFKETDGLPNYICKVCRVQMQQFNNFYMRFNRVQTRLREIQDEFFVGVPSVVNDTHVESNNLNAPPQWTSIPQTNPITEQDPGVNGQINGIKSSAVPTGVQQFTIAPPKGRTNKKTKAQPIVTPTSGGLNMQNVQNRCYGQPRQLGPPSSAVPLGNVGGIDKPIVPIPPTLRIVKGLPAGGNVQQSPKKAPSKTLPKFVPIMPKPTGPPSPANSTAIKKNIIPKPANARKSLTAKEKASAKRSISPNTSTVSGIFAKQISNSAITTSITIKTKSGTTTLSPAPTTFSKNTVTTSSAASANQSGRGPFFKQPPTVSASVAVPATEATPVVAPTVFKISDDIFDPNSPPAFCIPKTAGTVQTIPLDGVTIICGNSKREAVPLQNIVAPLQNVVSSPQKVVAPVQKVIASPQKVVASPQKVVASPQTAPAPHRTIKTEIIDEDDPLYVTKAVVAAHNSQITVSSQSALNSLQSKTQYFGKTPEKPKVQPAQQPPPHLQPALTGNKRQRKYWGAVDEFHIPSKVPSQTQATTGTCPEIPIKEEDIDLDEDSLTKDSESPNDDAFASMFYPDSFELGNVSLDAAVTDVLEHMIAHHQKSAESQTYQFTNPLPPLPLDSEKTSSSVNDEARGKIELSASEGKLEGSSKTNSESRNETKPKADENFKFGSHDDSKERTKPKHDSRSSERPKKQSDNSTTLKLRELRTKNGHKVQDIPNENKNNSNTSKLKKFHTKEFRIKLKINRNLQNLVLGAIRRKVRSRSCTISRRKSERLQKDRF